MGKSKKEIQKFWRNRGVHIPIEHVFTKAQNEQRVAQMQRQQAVAQQRALMEQMQAQQAALMAAAMNQPKASRSLRSADYQPKFKTRGSKVESKRAISRGTGQFTNPLGMGGGFGATGGTPNLG